MIQNLNLFLSFGDIRERSALNQIKKKIEDNNLKENAFFIINATERFNHLINEYISSNSKVSFDKF